MVEDMDWSARSENGEPIDVGEEVLIKEIQGVKLIVEKILLIVPAGQSIKNMEGFYLCRS